MGNNQSASVNWFDKGGSSYAQFRPSYPEALTQFLSKICSSHNKVVDVGCGNGQLTSQLAPYFSSVIGVDPSAEQIAHAKTAANIRYLTAPAEKLPAECQGADLVTAAQAAHWFKLPPFYEEVKKIAATKAILALISYGVLDLPSAFNDRFQHFYWKELGPLWPPERKFVDNGYRDLYFPFQELKTPATLMIEVEWDLAQFLGYVSTWSAVKAMKQQNKESILVNFGHDITALWKNPNEKHKVSWPINMRVGEVFTI